MQTLPCWLKLPGVTQVVVVDWSNRRPLVDLCAIDPRIHVVRVEEEQRWILSYAYNIGITHASESNILKCDADCIPASDITTHIPGEAHFFAGYWKSGAAVKKPSVNGQCIFTKTQFSAVNGYSELIRTYGRDDEDFYDRLILAGSERREIPVPQLDFIEHTSEERISNQFAPSTTMSVGDVIGRDPLYNEMKNLFVARQMPWNSTRPVASYTTQQQGERWTVLRRDKSKELVVPPAVEQAARLQSLRYIVSTLTNTPQASVNRLNEQACLAVIGPRLKMAKANS